MKIIILKTFQEKVTYANDIQRKELVRLVGDNYNALYGRLSNSANGALIKKTVWQSVNKQLNVLGPKWDPKYWKRTFNGMKLSTKEKLKRIRLNENRQKLTGVRVPGQIKLNELEAKIKKMIGLEALDGSQRLDEMGVGRHLDEAVDLTSNPASSMLARDNFTMNIPQRSREISIVPEDQDLELVDNDPPTHAVDSPLPDVQSQDQDLDVPPDVDSLPPVLQCQDQDLELVDNNPPTHGVDSPLDVQCQDEDLEVVDNDSTTYSVRTPPDVQSQARSIPLSATHDNINALFQDRGDELSEFGEGDNESARQSRGGSQSVIARTNVNGRYVQRRGVEIDYDRCADEITRHSDASNRRGVRRRYRLSMPLGVMASLSLQRQNTTNDLLREILEELRR